MSSTAPPFIPGLYIENQYRQTFSLSFIQSFFLTLIAELGDTTFIMLIILQLKANKITIFVAALLGQVFLNIIACTLGYTIDFMLYKNFIDYISILFFFIFGVWLIWNSPNESNKSFQSDLDSILKPINQPKKEKETNRLSIIPEWVREDTETGTIVNNKHTWALNAMAVPLWGNDWEESDSLKKTGTLHAIEEYDTVDAKVFWDIIHVMILSECGDRTQIAALTMSAVLDFSGVLLGSCLALWVTVTVGVYFGSVVIKYLKERVLNVMLGGVFLVYGMLIYSGK